LELNRLARAKGVSVQELIRALIIPDWIRSEKGKTTKRSR